MRQWLHTPTTAANSRDPRLSTASTTPTATATDLPVVPQEKKGVGTTDAGNRTTQTTQTANAAEKATEEERTGPRGGPPLWTTLVAQNGQ